MPAAPRIRWLDAPDPANYPSALSYLTLIFAAKDAKGLVRELADCKTVEFMAKDIFRASGLSLLGVSNTHVQRDLKKIPLGKALSPILLVRVPSLAKVIVADGYHRMCAVYSIDEDAVIPCRIA